MTKNTRESVMLSALEFAAEALESLSMHHAFADDAPEFNEGGVGHTAMKLVLDAIKIGQVEDTKEKDTFALYASTFGLTAEDFGRTFKFRKRLYKIVGCRPNSPRYPIMGARVPDGKTFKFPADHVAKNLSKV